MVKLNFQQPLLQPSVSHDPLIFGFGAQETFYINSVENNCNAIFVVKTVIYVFRDKN